MNGRLLVAAAFLLAVVACDRHDEPENVVVGNVVVDEPERDAPPCGGEGQPACRLP